MIQGFSIACLIFLSYTIVAVNTIAISKRNYLPTIISSTLFMVVNFFLIQHIAEAKTLSEFVGYCIGGVTGDVCGIWVSTKLKIG